MKQNDIMIIPYDPKYAVQTVKMWRDSKYEAIGQKEVHSFENHVYFLDHILPTEFKIEIAVVEEKVVGVIAYHDSQISQLYIHTGYQRLGIGSRLLENAMAHSTGKLQVYTFEVNKKAQHFYEKKGFEIIGRGHENEENLPDILYEWKAG
ncbi:GNAT family N-acetyltransferase [Pseudalkalibacillus sp. Hm43]|uniref:GNAT family N-acetyltransferase n=1 Tax=Pseudalkalibacillus sp. Hm43 TaxID=3450742 RepID=UPI003F43FC70